MNEQQSGGQKSRQPFRRAAKTLQDAAGTLSGKNLVQVVAEQGEVYTQVLLGLHSDLQRQEQRLSFRQ